MKKILFTTLLASYAGLMMAQDIITNNAWVRFSVSGMSSSGAFMDLDNHSGKDDVLLSASSPIAKSSEIHETVKVNGVMKMRPLAHGLSLPAGQVTQLQPGKMHIMLLGLKKPLVKGTTIPIRLTFRYAKPVTLNVPVSVAPVTKTDPTMPEHSHMHH